MLYAHKICMVAFKISKIIYFLNKKIIIRIQFLFQAGPSEKHSGMDARQMNSSFPKIDNLEYFPLKVLMQIFAKLGDMDLVNLAENSYRFETIAKLVISERYTRKYFKVKRFYGFPQNAIDIPKTLADLFGRFGSQIKSIETEEFRTTVKNHWISSLLAGLTNLEKLTFRLIGNGFNENFLQRHANITHLTLRVRIDIKRNLFKGIALPEFSNLKKLQVECYPCISFESLKEVIRNNPALESLRLIRGGSEMDESYPFDEI